MEIISATSTEIVARFPHTMAFDACPELTREGVRFAKVYGNLIEPELAARRAAMGGWSAGMCEAGRIVVYQPETSALVSALYGAR